MYTESRSLFWATAVTALAAATRVWRDFFPNKEEVYKFGLKSMKQGWAKAGR